MTQSARYSPLPRLAQSTGDVYTTAMRSTSLLAEARIRRLGRVRAQRFSPSLRLALNLCAITRSGDLFVLYAACNWPLTAAVPRPGYNIRDTLFMPRRRFPPSSTPVPELASNFHRALPSSYHLVATRAQYYRSFYIRHALSPCRARARARTYVYISERVFFLRCFAEACV